LNVAAIALYKAELTERLQEQVDLHLELFRKGIRPLPPYIILSDVPVQGSSLLLYNPSFEGKIVFVDASIFQRRLRDFSLSLFLWEAALVLGLSYVLYRLLGRYLKERERTRESLELLLLALSHRLGNMLAAQRVNIEILRERYDPEVLDRLERSYHFIEGQFRETMELVRLLPKGEGEDLLDLREIVRKVLEPIGDQLEGKEVKVTLKSFSVKAPRTELEVAVQLLVENAIKYSEKWVKISGQKTKEGWELVIENDLASGVPSGSGLGLELARRLVKKFGGDIETAERDGRFRQVLRAS